MLCMPEYQPLVPEQARRDLSYQIKTFEGVFVECNEFWREPYVFEDSIEVIFQTNKFVFI